MSCSLSPLLFGDIQREAAAKLREAQRERDEALQGMAQAQVPIARVRMSSTHLMSDVMFARLV